MNFDSKLDIVKTKLSYCLNPKCNNPENSFDAVFCQSCHSELLLDSQYRAIKKLGDNGFIGTYLADENGQEKILKVLYNYTEETLELFKKQIDLLADNHYVGIANIERNSYFRFFPKNIDDPLHCILVEKIDGQTLKQWMEKRDSPIREKLALIWLLQLIKILEKLHQQNIIHGNINPDHIILTPSGELILTNLPSLPDVSTKGYAPREQEEGYLFPQSDFFSLGRTFVYLLTNKEPLNFYEPYEDRLNWRESNQTLNTALADYLDYLMGRLANQRPKNTQVIKRRLTEIQQGFEKKVDVNNIQENNDSELIKSSQEITVSSDNLIPNNSPKIKKKHRQKKKKKSKVLRFFVKNWLIAGSFSLLVFILTSQIYAFLANKYSSNPLTIISSIFSLRNSFGENLGSISKLSFNSNGKNLVSASGNHIDIWDISSEEKINTLEGHNDQIETFVFSPDNKILVSGSADKTIKVWDVATGKEKNTLFGHNFPVKALAFSHDSRIFASGSADGTIILWNSSTGLPITSIFAHQDWISSLAFSPDGKKLISGSGDKTIKIWDVDSKKELMTLDGHSLWVNSVQFSPDGTIIASGSGDRTIKLWDAESGKLLNTLEGHTNAVNEISFSKDGQYLASGSTDKQIKIWEVKTGKLLKTFAGHTTPINTVVFSPTQNILASADENGTIKIWKVE